MGRRQTAASNPSPAPTEAPPAPAAATRCRVCDSTERTKLSEPQVQEYAGENGGKIFTHIIRQRVQCKCGQIRIETNYAHRKPAPARNQSTDT